MTFAEAVFLGIIQGATEFLPVSSSGHLVIAEYFMDLGEVSIDFDVILHLGTLMAVLSYFWRDWLAMAASVLSGKMSDRKKQSRRMLLFVLAGTIPGAVAGFLVEDLVSTVFRSPWVVVSTLAGVALLLWLAERTARYSRNSNQMILKDAVAIGTAHILDNSFPVHHMFVEEISKPWRIDKTFHSPADIEKSRDITPPQGTHPFF